MKRIRRRYKYVLIALAILITSIIGFVWLSTVVNDSYSQYWSSLSVAEAEERGILLEKLVVEPRTVYSGIYKVDFLEAWVEQGSQNRHRFIFFNTVEKLPFTRFVVHYQTTIDGHPVADSIRNTTYLSEGDDGSGIPLGDMSYLRGAVKAPNARIGTDTVYLSIITDWKKPRAKNIKVYAKP